MSDHSSVADLPDLGRTHTCPPRKKISSIADHDHKKASIEAQNRRYPQFNIQWAHKITSTSSIFRYPNPSLPQSQPRQETTKALPLYLIVPKADQNRRVVGRSESEHDVAFTSPNQEGEDFCGTMIDTSSAPIIASRCRPMKIRTSPALESCASGAPRRFEQDEEVLNSVHTNNGALSSIRIPLVPMNSPHEGPKKDDEEKPCSSRQWPHYWKPTVEDGEEDTIKCYDPETGNGAEPGTALLPSRPSGLLEGRLERNENASSGSIHANVQRIDDVKNCPAANQAQDVTAASNDSEPKYLVQKRQEMLEESQQVDVWQAKFGQPSALDAPNSLTSHLTEAGCMVDMVEKRDFKPTPKWLADYSGVFELAQRGNTYPPMTFVKAGFTNFLSADEKPKLENHQSQKQLDIAANKGVVDACEAVKRIMSVGRSRPTDAWCKHCDALTFSAQDRGDVEPLVEFVRLEAHKMSVRNASERAHKAKDSLRQSYNNIDLDEFGNETRSSLKNGPEVGYEDGTKVAHSDHSHDEIHQEYATWLIKNYQSETEPFGNKFIYIANSIHPIVARLDNFETKEPFVMKVSHYFDEFRLLASVFIVVLAVKVTPAEKQRSVDTYAEVRLRDSPWFERFDSPSRIEGFSAQGQPFNLDDESIIAMVEAKLCDHFDRTAPEDSKFGTNSEPISGSRSSSSIFRTTLRRRDSDQSQSQFQSSDKQPHIYLSPEETQKMHPNVVAERGMTLVPPQDFPEVPADQHSFALYPLSIGAPSSSVFVNCQRCHKTLASFENVKTEPTVARRKEGEPGDTYIVTSISSLDHIIDSVDKVKRVWLQIGTHKYFMRAKEAGRDGSHECLSIQDKLGVVMDQEEHQTAAGYYTQNDQEALRCDEPGNLPPREPRDHTQIPHSEREQPADQGQPDSIPRVRVPSSIQFLPVHPSLPTAELTSVREPCTIISVCEQRGIIHGVYQGVIGYRAIFRGPGERGHRVYLDIRDGLGGYIGRLSRIRHYEVGLMNGQVSAFTAEDEPEERIDSMISPHQPDQGHNMGGRGGAPPVEDWTDTEAETCCSDDEEMSLRDGANVEQPDSDDDVIRGPPEGAWIQSGVKVPTLERQKAASVSLFQPSNDPPMKEWISTGTTSSPPKQQTDFVPTSLITDLPKEVWMTRRALLQKQTSQQTPANASQSDAEPKKRWIPTGNSVVQPKMEQKLCACSTLEDKEGARASSVSPGAPTQPLVINESAKSDDSVRPSRRDETALNLSHGGAPKDVSTHSQQRPGPVNHSSVLKDIRPAKAPRDLRAATLHQLMPSNDPLQPRLPQDDSERIPFCLQAGPQSDVDRIEGEEPVFNESYKKWLRGIYTRPSYSTCGSNPNPGPSFQDFWQDREAGRQATMADGKVLRPRERPRGQYHGVAVGDSEHSRMESDCSAGPNNDEGSPFIQQLESNVRQFDQGHGRWHGADVEVVEDISLLEEPPHREEMTSPSTVKSILKRYLRRRAVHTSRAVPNQTSNVG